MIPYYQVLSVLNISIQHQINPTKYDELELELKCYEPEPIYRLD